MEVFVFHLPFSKSANLSKIFHSISLLQGITWAEWVINLLIFMDPPGDNDFSPPLCCAGDNATEHAPKILNFLPGWYESEYSNSTVSPLFDFREMKTDFLLCVNFNTNLPFLLYPLTFCLFVSQILLHTWYSLLSLSHCICLLILSLYLPLFISLSLSPPLSFSLFPTFVEKSENRVRV